MEEFWRKVKSDFSEKEDYKEAEISYIAPCSVFGGVTY